MAGAAALLQWLSRTRGGVAHGWEQRRAHGEGGKAVTAPRALRGRARPGCACALAARRPGSVHPAARARLLPALGSLQAALLSPPVGAQRPGTGARPRAGWVRAPSPTGRAPRSPAGTRASLPITRRLRAQPRTQPRGAGGGWPAAGFSRRRGACGRAEVPYLSPRARVPAPASSPLGSSCRGRGPSSGTPTCRWGPRWWAGREAREAGPA